MCVFVCVVCVFVCVVCVFVCVVWVGGLGTRTMYYLCAGARGQLWRSFLKCCLPLFSKQGLPLALNWMSRLGCLTH